jgi:GNAT superfamily N-acetyltransferase
MTLTRTVQPIDDLEVLAPLARQFYDELPPEDYPPKAAGLPFDWEHLRDYWTLILDAGIGSIWVARDEEGRPIGFLQALRYRDNPTGALVAAEEYWYVESARRDGSGMALWGAFNDWATEIGADFQTAAWSVPTFRVQLDKFYQAAGFSQIAGIYMRKT